ncbi:MAG: universal stress protein [Bacteroidota bacterium]
MYQIKNILFPIDLPSADENAFKYAVEIGNRLGAVITLFHVYTTPGEDAAEIDFDTLENIFVGEMQGFVNGFFRNYSKDRLANMKIQYATAQGNFINQTIVYCRGNGIDLVVMGVSKRNRFAEILFGSSTQGILDHVEIPVLFVPKYARFKELNRIVYASNLDDGNITALNNLKSYSKICKKIDLKLLYLHDDALAEDELRGADWFEFADANPKITWQVLSNNDEIDLLEEYLEKNHEEIDILAMLHKKRGMFEGFFRRNLAREMSYNETTPLLVFQSETGRLRGFLPKGAMLSFLIV